MAPNIKTIAMLASLAVAMVLQGCGDEPTKIAQVCADAGGSEDARRVRARDSVSAAVAVLRYNDQEGFLCSGVVVGETKVLTAAHCLDGDAGWAFEVFFAADLLTGGLSAPVKSSTTHPSLDLAVLSVAEPVPTEPPLRAWSADPPSSEHRARSRVTGYGGPAGGIEKCLRVTERVQDIVVNPFGDDPLELGVLVDGDVHRGDSGGPLVVDVEGAPSVVVGILHGLVTGATQGTLATYVRLPVDDPWVVEAFGSAPVPLH